ncbi:LysM peptidoglycan-binding domain-containing protein [Streptococcus suis]|uniref:LysM peptidoglycan-binding domain-containing protein n=1 Tax=Streptococcus suis TaxID=1307 RepID=UPI00192E1A7D|nr:LysM peptidoglycan-binding domain-containing protein [Streptococcus suis]MBL6504353.1 LysM peptidoglycan-binding domain-containing protein [Streptococcus suis]MBM0241969.1 LysM peptidoglycan-binding domain-containing protein [Streptococcus suis]MBM7205094.1 LysM peptidoglycan-binding domain-containing protein [Streptococcus suis]MBM7282465.1 LysM peptidoglycan-binding domain-containing protein [Streptococcus suis]MBO4135982.1 LysM peptidoglycan-binding domain-containing protein [Streptococc
MKKFNFGYRKVGKVLVACVVAVAIFGVASVASADTWVANSPESILIVPGQTTYELKLGDTLWAISQKINTTVENLAELNGIDLLSGEEKRLSVGRQIVLPGVGTTTIEKNPADEVTSDGVVNTNLSTANVNVVDASSSLTLEELMDRVESVEVTDGATYVKLKDGESMDDFVKDLEEATKETPKPTVPGAEEVPVKPLDPIVPEAPIDVTEEEPLITDKGEGVTHELPKGEIELPTEPTLPVVPTDPEIPTKPVEENPKLPRKVNTVVVAGSVLNGRLVSDNSKVVLNQVVDFGQTKFQSFYEEDGKYYSLHDLATSPVTVYDSKGNIIDQIYKEATGHNNDVIVLGNEKYIAPGGTKLYVWNTDSNAVSTINLETIVQYGKDYNTRIDIGGIAQSTSDSNLLYLVGLDKHATSAIEREKGANIIVFTYDKTTGKQELFLRDELDYIGLLQGATEYNGVLYLAQNTKTDNYNLSDYKGITIKAYDTATASHIDDVQIDGVMEAEGMQVVEREDGSSEIAFGLVNGSVKKVVSIEPIEPTSVNESIETETVEIAEEANEVASDAVAYSSEGESIESMTETQTDSNVEVALIVANTEQDGVDIANVTESEIVTVEEADPTPSEEVSVESLTEEVVLEDENSSVE